MHNLAWISVIARLDTNLPEIILRQLLKHFDSWWKESSPKRIICNNSNAKFPDKERFRSHEVRSCIMLFHQKSQKENCLITKHNVCILNHTCKLEQFLPPHPLITETTPTAQLLLDELHVLFWLLKLRPQIDQCILFCPPQQVS